MPTGYYVRTQEYRKIMSKAMKGYKPINMFEKGHIPWNKNKNTKQIPWNKDKHLPEKIKRKISNAVKGKKHNNWKGGITLENKKIRRSIDFRLWREAIFARDNWTCQKCKDNKGHNLRPHHIQNFAQYPKLRFAIDNGITFCEKCHKEFHKIYGVKNNNQKQINDFLQRSFVK